jgi:ATP-binding cassette subfamily F protein uup
MVLARLDNVSLAFGLRPLLDGVNLVLNKGDRLCLLGRNGEGKSSLIKLVDRQIRPDHGEVWTRPGTRIAALAQESSGDLALTVREVLASGVVPGEHDQEWQAALSINQVLSRLELDPAARMGDLSGGWRRRALLGRALVSEPDLLLLDEPTNHLDIEAISYLEELLLSFAGALLFVSHDRSFIRRIATRILALDRGKLTEYPPDYDRYLDERAAALATETKHAALFDKKLAQEEVWIRQGIEARRTRNEGRVRALKQLRIERRDRREQQGQVELTAQSAAPSGRLVFEATHVGLSFEDRIIIRDFSARILRGERIGIIGPNGSGKTTLIRLLTGDLQPTSGTMRQGTKLELAYFDQQRAQLNENLSVMDNITGGGETVLVQGKPRHVSGYLRDFLFAPERLNSPVSMLSGGERNRLLLAKLFARPSNVLIMDEPTNDLDVDTLELLEEFVADYAGTLLLVSHDREFLDNVVTSTLVFEGNGVVREYVGGYSDWLAQRPAPAAASAGKPKQKESPAEPTSRARRLSYNEQRELNNLPDRIQALESEEGQLQAQVSDPDLFKRDHAQASAALKRLSEIAAELQDAYARWDALESRAKG